MSTASIDELEPSITLASGQTWNLDSTEEALSLAHRLAPQYAVDATIQDWYAGDPIEWLAVADLRWRTGYGDYADIPGYDHRHIGLAGNGDGPALTYGDHRCTDLTRPFQNTAADRGGLSRRSGFVLGVADGAEILHKGAPNMQAPYFVESWRLKTEGESIWIPIFWMFNAASIQHGGHVLWQFLLNQWSERSKRKGSRSKKYRRLTSSILAVFATYTRGIGRDSERPLIRPLIAVRSILRRARRSTLRRLRLGDVPGGDGPEALVSRLAPLPGISTMRCCARVLRRFSRLR